MKLIAKTEVKAVIIDKDHFIEASCELPVGGNLKFDFIEPIDGFNNMFKIPRGRTLHITDGEMELVS